MEGIIFDIQHFCVNDGTGIRTNVFLKGCPLSCVWCHNPESQKSEIEWLIYPEKCTGCGRCKGVSLNGEDFICFHEAKQISGKRMTSDQVLAEVLQDSSLYTHSGGGLTLSGGEPLAQFDFALEILKKAKENGLNTAIETSGFTSAERIKEMAQYVDCFLYDYKETNPDLHKKYTGVDNVQILKNLKVLDDLGKDIVLRCPIIPGHNDREDHFDGIIRVANSHKNVQRIDVEPYHALGEAKYVALGRQAIRAKTPEKEQIQAWIERIQQGTSVVVKQA